MVKIIQQWRISKAWRNSQRLEPRRVCFARLLSGREGFVAILGSVVVVGIEQEGREAASGCVWRAFLLTLREFCDKRLGAI